MPNNEINKSLKYHELSLIKINSLKYFFTKKDIVFLESLGIYNLSTLLKLSFEDDFLNLIEELPLKESKRLNSLIKLLKCKYLNIDPDISCDNNLDLKDFLSNFGLSTWTYNFFLNSCQIHDYKVRDIIKLIKTCNISKILNFLNTTKIDIAKELIEKLSIVINYNENLKNSYQEIKLREYDIDSLHKELKILYEDSLKIFQKIKDIYALNKGDIYKSNLFNKQFKSLILAYQFILIRITEVNKLIEYLKDKETKVKNKKIN